ncbi:MAG: helix-hairpin-helix domain-containing protein [Armatimonadota bacterium]
MDLSRGQKLLVIIGLLALLGGIVVLSLGRLASQPAAVVYSEPAAKKSATTPVGVHVVGAVARPGLYWLRPGSRVSDALALAGGTTPTADQASANLAAIVEDGQQIKVLERPATVVPQAAPTPAPVAAVPPPARPQPTQPIAAAATLPPAPRMVNLNQATKDQLETLPDIGPELAQRILYYRHENGGFRSLEELTKVEGIGPSRVEALRPFVSF